MKACSGLCVVTVFLLLCAPWSSMAQLDMICDANSTIGNNVRLLSELLMESPYPECKDQLVNLAFVPVDEFVDNAATVFTALAVICETNCTNYVLRFALQCQPSYVDLLGLACGRNEADLACYQTVLRNNGTGVLHQCFPEQFRLEMETTTEEQATDSNTTTTAAENTMTTAPPSPSFVCRNECRAELESFRAFHGCCISNAFNSSTFGLQRFGLANYSLWGACGVEPIVGFCPLPFTLPVTTTAAPTTASDFTVAASGFTVAAEAMLILMVALITSIAV